MKHTPKPWALDGRILMGKYGTPIADIVSERAEDARLIAAAPELLEALKEARQRVEEVIERFNDLADIKCLSRIDAVIAKAEGRS